MINGAKKNKMKLMSGRKKQHKFAIIIDKLRNKKNSPYQTKLLMGRRHNDKKSYLLSI